MDAYAGIEADFLARFPGGLSDPDWQALAKKHKSYSKAVTLCQQELAPGKLALALERDRLADVVQACRQAVSLATTVSTFEKIAFRNFLDYSQAHRPFVQALHDVLADCNAATFAAYVDALSLMRHDSKANAAKWPIVTCFLACYAPKTHVCIKPTTIKKLAARLGVDVHYQSLPNYECYQAVQAMVLDFKRHSPLAAEQDNTIAQAIMYCSVA